MLGISMGIEFCQTWPRVGCPGVPDNEGKCHKGNAGAVPGAVGWCFRHKNLQVNGSIKMSVLSSLDLRPFEGLAASCAAEQ